MPKCTSHQLCVIFQFCKNWGWCWRIWNVDQKSIHCPQENSHHKAALFLHEFWWMPTFQASERVTTNTIHVPSVPKKMPVSEMIRFSLTGIFSGTPCSLNELCIVSHKKLLSIIFIAVFVFFSLILFQTLCTKSQIVHLF